MPALQPIFLKAYWTLAIIGILWAGFLTSLINPTLQRHALYAHRISSAYWLDVTNPEGFGFASKYSPRGWLRLIVCHRGTGSAVLVGYGGWREVVLLACCAVGCVS
ncbi:hypothetical protein BDU57DRAFT_520957 [Ampelomyces quisqualis]|uniref:Uncharacterized protein n=1 Tax=Ampelomyces quisqualis TaxID=50730 RepID=A0A6A5QHC2_AMPQU|nr:hypothetical protein BDU57DRAFT_520957 [Ampelomyces quisqualis]